MAKTKQQPKQQPATTTTTTVNADDERKRNALYSCVTLRDEAELASGVRWTFKNGETVAITAEQLLGPIYAEAAMHGIKQKVNDAAAMSRNPETGQSATDADKVAAMREVMQRLLSGEWNAKRGDGESNSSLLLRAILRAYPEKNAEKVREWLKSRSDAEKKAMLEKNPAIKSAADAIRAEKVSNDVDVEALDAELDQLA